MNDQAYDGIDPRALGPRIQAARKAKGISQQTLAADLGVSRPVYINIEKGQRRVRADELIRIAELVDCTVHELQRRREPVHEFAPLFRTRSTRLREADADIERAAAQLQQLCDDYVELETIRRSPLKTDYPAPHTLHGRDQSTAAELIADSERRRLGMGDGPVANLRQLLEAEAGLRVFLLDLRSPIAGLFVFAEPVGACIGLQRNHPSERQKWTLAHEYAHFLTHRHDAEVTVLQRSPRDSDKERFADAFAANFLMPEYGLKRRFAELLQSNKAVTVGAMVALADAYGVSFEAISLRLEGLRLIRSGTWDSLQQRGFRVTQAKDILGLPARSKERELPERYVIMAAQAFDDGQISEGELMRFLRTDRQQAREMVRDMNGRWAVTSDGSAGELQLNLAEAVTR